MVVVLLTLAFVVYIYWSVGSAGVVKLNIFINFLQLLAQSYVVDAVKFLPMAEFAVSSVMELADICFVPLAWWDMWLFVMMTPWIHIALVLLLFGARLLWRAVHRRLKHPERPCFEPTDGTTAAAVRDADELSHSTKLRTALHFVTGDDRSEGRTRVTAVVNTIQAVIQLIFFNNLQIAKACLVMFACVNIFGVSVAYDNYGFACGTPLHALSIALSVVWLALFCVALPVFVLVAIRLPAERQPQWMQRLIDVRFVQRDFKEAFNWWEVMFNARRLVFAVIVTVIAVAPNLKVLVFAVFALAFLLAQMACQPYRYWLDNVLEAVSLTAVLLTFLVQSHVLAYGDPNDGALIFVVVLNGVVGLTLLVFVVLEAIPVVAQKVEDCFCTRKRIKAMTAASHATELARRTTTTDDVEMEGDKNVLAL